MPAPAGAAVLEQRLRAAAEAVLDDCPAPSADPAQDAVRLLASLVALARATVSIAAT